MGFDISVIIMGESLLSSEYSQTLIAYTSKHSSNSDNRLDSMVITLRTCDGKKNLVACLANIQFHQPLADCGRLQLDMDWTLHSAPL